MLEFLNAFPEEIEEDPSEEVRQEEFLRRFKTGRQMLEGVVIGCLPDISMSNSVWGERAAFPGYPTADGVSGSFFEPCGNNWAMSAACSNKSAAWEFMRMPVARRYNIRDGAESLPHNVGQGIVRPVELGGAVDEVFETLEIAFGWIYHLDMYELLIRKGLPYNPIRQFGIH